MRRGEPRAQGGFSIIELLFVILIIFLLMALLIGGIKFVSSRAKGVADQAAVKAIGQGAALFKSQFGFYPPLVRDYDTTVPGNGPLNQPKTAPLIYSVSDATHLAFLKGPSALAARAPDMRFSLYSLPYYLLGALDEKVDGQAGPGFKTPKRDGSFEKAGRAFDPFFDVSRNAKAVFETKAGSGRIELRDSHGVAFRWYRWVNGNTQNNVVTAADLHIPLMVGGSSAGPDVKGAEYAIVGAGPNGLFGDEDIVVPDSGPDAHPQHMTIQDMALKLGISGDPVADATVRQRVLDAARADNIVEVLR